MKYFLSYDVGTSSVKAILINQDAEIISTAIHKYDILMPQEGWVEQVPSDYWEAIVETTRKMLQESGISKESVVAMVFTTQAMGIIPLGKDNKILYNNISWVDGRAEVQAQQAMKRLGGKLAFKQILGIEITGKDVVPKLMWIKEKQPELYKKTHKFLDVNAYLKWKATGKIVAEWSGACSYAFNLKKKDWERLFFKINGIDIDKLPDLVKSTDAVANLSSEAAKELGLTEQVIVYGGCDDTQSAAMGASASGEGDAHIYLGTSAWIGVSTKQNIKFKNGAVCLQSADPEKNLVVGITESAGINIDWMIDVYYKEEKERLGTKKTFELIEKEVLDIPPGADHLIATPWFLGERTPISTTTTRATLFNLTHNHSRAHIARAYFEGIAYNLRWTIDNMEKDFGFKIDKINVLGGGSQNHSWMQMMANVLGRPITNAKHYKFGGALGGSVCALVGSGEWHDFEHVKEKLPMNTTFKVDYTTKSIYDEMFKTYKNVYLSLKNVYLKTNSKRF